MRSTFLGLSGRDWRGRARKVLPLALVLGGHLALVALIMTWRPPPMGLVARAIEVSLNPGDGVASAFNPLTAPPAATAVDAKPTIAPAQPDPETPAAAKTLGASLMLNSREPVQVLMPFLEDLSAGSPNLTSDPVQLKPQVASPSQASADTAGGKSCQILENLKSALQASVAVRVSLSLIPKQARSVANAILLWDGRWIDPSSVGGSQALQPIEQAFADTVGHAPPNCQAEIVHGPRLITLGDARDTTVLAFGSGDWRWTDAVATISPIASQ